MLDLPYPEGSVMHYYYHPITGETAQWLQVGNRPEPQGLIEDGYIRITDIPCDDAVEMYPVEAAPIHYCTTRQ